MTADKKMPSCIAGKRNTETITFLYLKNRKRPNLDERSVREKAFLLIGPRTRASGCERNNLINMVSVYSKTAAGVCQWGHHLHKTLVFSV